MLEVPLQLSLPSTAAGSMRLPSAAAQSGGNVELSSAAVSSGVAARQPPPRADDGATSSFDQQLPLRSARASACSEASSSTLGVTAAAMASATPSTLSDPLPPKAGPKVPAATTTTRSAGKRVVTAASADEAHSETVAKKRSVETRSSSARPPVMPTSTGTVRTPSLYRSVDAAPDNSLCQLFVEGGRLVADVRLLKSKRVLHGRVMDADLVVVCLLSARARMYSYPYQGRFPPPSPQRTRLRMADMLRTSIVWSRTLVRVV